MLKYIFTLLICYYCNKNMFLHVIFITLLQNRKDIRDGQVLNLTLSAVSFILSKCFSHILLNCCVVNFRVTVIILKRSIH